MALAPDEDSSADGRLIQMMHEIDERQAWLGDLDKVMYDTLDEAYLCWSMIMSSPRTTSSVFEFVCWIKEHNLRGEIVPKLGFQERLRKVLLDVSTSTRHLGLTRLLSTDVDSPEPAEEDGLESESSESLPETLRDRLISTFPARTIGDLGDELDTLRRQEQDLRQSMAQVTSTLQGNQAEHNANVQKRGKERADFDEQIKAFGIKQDHWTNERAEENAGMQREKERLDDRNAKQITEDEKLEEEEERMKEVRDKQRIRHDTQEQEDDRLEGVRSKQRAEAKRLQAEQERLSDIETKQQAEDARLQTEDGRLQKEKQRLDEVETGQQNDAAMLLNIERNAMEDRAELNEDLESFRHDKQELELQKLEIGSSEQAAARDMHS